MAPRPMVDVSEQGDRVLYAAKLYQQHQAPLIIASGGRIDWLTVGQPEAAAMAELLQLIRNKALRLWLDASREDKIDKYALNKYCRLLAQEYQ